jgi:hypothetical protein
MDIPKDITQFLAGYDEPVFQQTMLLRKMLLQTLPDVTEQIDISAKMIAYTYGQKYTELVCVIIPSKKGLKLGFNQGPSLPDPEGLLEGEGKISRYVVIKSETDVTQPALKELVVSALDAFKKRTRKQ